MMDMQTWLLYTSTVVLLCLTPGPNSLLAVTNGLKYGLSRAVLSTVGCMCGLTLLIAVSLTGVGLVLAASPTAFLVIKWLGAGYLIYLGLALLWSRRSLVDAADDGSRRSAPTALGLFAQGFLVVTMNPKVLIFFVAFLPQFHQEGAPYWFQTVVLAGTFVAVEFTIEVLLAASASRLIRHARAARGLRAVNCATGGLFIAAGAWLLTAERPR